ncbi:hypothetical protein [Arenibacter troitsensis]|uniref:Uncharacterized protein n=1 Tax=Arenibacter troitsensis TaxID=188872 RepID=A0A1X7KC52_9FLAO|nr:hypothetical protein [Arenibacter troitsensis]SMG38420.1 hypothetical protein SAMN03080602_02743 [Arenibacter troitsensis]
MKFKMMKNFFLPLILMCGLLGMSQAELNKYKYIIVPTKFETFKHENQYQTSTMIKYNLVENGFTAVYDNDMPADLLANRCLGLLLNLKDDSSMFTTKVTLTLKDCQSNVVYTTVEGSSKEKDYKSAYSEAIKECFKSLSGLGYKYEPSGDTDQATVSFKNDVKRIEEKSSVAPNQNIPNPVVQQKATLQEQSYKNMEPVQSNIAKAENMPTLALPDVDYKTEDSGVLYAQAIANGFQLVDSTPKITLRMYATSQANFYIAEGDVHSGVVLKKADKWYFEYYEGDKLMGQELNIKF